MWVFFWTELWRRIRAYWTRVDTLVVVSNSAALGLHIGNCWWESVTVCYLASLVPLLCQVLPVWGVPTLAWEGHTRPNVSALRHALCFGAMVGWSWPLGEYLVVHIFGWWGRYLAPGPTILETPVYCILVGWLASAYCYYVGRRTLDFGYGRIAASVTTGVTALGLGILGENLFVGSGMWVYEDSRLHIFAVPAFVPIGYAISYAALPFLRRFPLVLATLIFNGLTLIITTTLGFLFGFFPR